MNKIAETNGTLRISREVLASIARSAALEIDGVYSIAEAPVVMRNMLKGNYSKPISVSIKDDIAEIVQKDVNNYIEVGKDGKRKIKGGTLVRGIGEAVHLFPEIKLIVIAGVNFANSAAAVK